MCIVMLRLRFYVKFFQKYPVNVLAMHYFFKHVILQTFGLHTKYGHLLTNDGHVHWTLASVLPWASQPVEVFHIHCQSTQEFLQDV